MPPAPQNPSATQLGHATRVMAANPDLRFAPGLGWLEWDGHKWAPDAEGQLIAAVHRAANRYSAISPGPFANELASRRGLEDVSIICRDIPGTRVRPADLDQHPGLLHARGITWNLETGAAQPTSRDELNTRALTHEPRAGAPLWHAFLESCFPGEPEMPAYLQRLIGYGLTGLATEHIFVIFQGLGANGKSVFINALTHAFRPYTVHLPVQVLMTAGTPSNGEGASPQLMRLRGARLVFTSESEREGRLDEAKVKLLTGGDELSVRGLYQSAVTFRPEALFVMATNHLPEIRGTDRGIWRRVKVVEWRESFEGRMDERLTQKLRAEAPGIIDWAMDGAAEWYRRGFAEPDRVAGATEAYRDESDFLGSFVPDWLAPDPDGWMPRSAVMDVWDNFVNANARNHLKNNATLYAGLRERGLQEATRSGVRGFRAKATRR